LKKRSKYSDLYSALLGQPLETVLNLPFPVECRCKKVEDPGFADTPGGRIRQARLKKHMTIVDVSALTGITTATLGHIEKNCCNAALDSLRKLSKAAGFPGVPALPSGS